MTITDPLSLLTSRLPQIQTSCGDLSGQITALIAELRMIGKLGLTDARSRLDMDLGNLVDNLSDLCAFKESGFVNADVAATEEAVVLLVNDMRARAQDALRNRAASVRINAEVSASRADVDAAPVDITDGYRLLAAAPVEQGAYNDGQVIRDFPVPDRGGLAGRIEGEFLSAIYDDPDRHESDVSPVDTFFLPAGRCISLMKGEQISLRIQGIAMDRKTIDLHEFEAEQRDMLIEAYEDDVKIHGPATISQCVTIPLGSLRTDLLALDQNFKSFSTTEICHIRGTSPDSAGSVILIIMGMMIVSGIVAAPAAMWHASIRPEHHGLTAIIFGSLFMTSLMSCIMGVVKMDNIKDQKLRKKAAFNMDVASLKERASEIFNSLSLEINDLSVKDHLGRMSKNVSARFYAARRGVVRETQGVRVIEPLPALPAPTPDVIDITTMTRPKMKA